jgi:hypothetical protein
MKKTVQNVIDAKGAGVFSIDTDLSVFDAGYNVELVVDTPIEVVQRHLGPWATATTLGANTTRIEMSVPDLGWAVLMLAVLNADIRHIEPAELRTLLQRFGAPILHGDEPLPSRELTLFGGAGVGRATGHQSSMSFPNVAYGFRNCPVGPT